MMEPHDFLDDDSKNDAALFVLDAHTVEFARSYRLHLAHCEVCRAEVETLSRTARELTLVAPERTPPPDLWQRVLQRVRKTDPRARADGDGARPEATQIWKNWTPNAHGETPDFTFLASDAGAFEPTAVPGIAARKLFVDHENGRVTMLVRMQPGASYPPHVHADVEECFVLAGDLSVGTQRMNAGDYQRAETGSTHAVQSTEKGCVLLLVSSFHDELV
jgi:quercetin dioxygenase-like cupin family protein